VRWTIFGLQGAPRLGLSGVYVLDKEGAAFARVGERRHGKEWKGIKEWLR
jgi:hypothetical protein